jgi:prophage regulatory protein
MTGNNFHPEIVARAVELIRAGLDPHELRRQVHREHPELTAQGVERVLDIARQEIVERDRPGMHDQMTDQATADQQPEKGFRSAEPRRMLTLAQVLDIVPLKRTTLFKMEKNGTFPASHYASANRRFWFADDLARWQANLPTNNRISR